MRPLRKRRLITVLSIVSGLAVAIGLGLYAMQQNINLFYPPSKVSEAPTNVLIRVGGLVVKDSVKRDPDSLEVEFQLTDNEGDIRVLYDGILPDLFREGQGIVTMGKLQENGDFVASEVLAKHDENYMSPEIAEAIKQAEAKAMKRGSEP
ncbi:MAG: cytochrome c maturation protein CcmE [Gammaproteobacteria bacterium]